MKQSERLRNAIFSINKMIHCHEPIMDIPKSEVIVLKIIDELNDKVKISDISNKLNISNAAVSQVIGSLESKKLLTREFSLEDRRVVYVALTKEGINMLENTQKLMNKFMDILVDKMGKEDSEELIRILNKLELLLKEGDVCREINN